MAKADRPSLRVMIWKEMHASPPQDFSGGKMACGRRARRRSAKASSYPSEHPVRFVLFT
jgi:hypothetical protein